MEPSINPDRESAFNRHFLPGFATLWSAAAMVYVGAITFWPIPKENQRFADTVLGFLLGSVVATLLKFYYDTSKSSQIKDATLADIAKAPAAGSATVFPQAGSETVVKTAESAVTTGDVK